jgi:ABC-type amino acid transport substrate-binding protein
MAHETSKDNIVLIIIAIIGILGTIVASAIGLLTSYNIEKQRQDFELTKSVLVSIANQSRATQVVLERTVNAPTQLPPFAPTAYPAFTQLVIPTVTTSNTASLLNEILSRGTIVISTNPNFQPQSFLNPANKRLTDTKCASDQLTSAELQGFDIDVSNQIGLRLGVEPCFATPSFDAITTGNWGNEWDISVGSLQITPERTKVLAFTNPYYYDDESNALGIAIDYSHSLPIKTLLATINQILDDMHKDGTLSALSMQWFGKDLTTK